MQNVRLGLFPLLPRKKKTDKSHYGHTLVLAGSKNLTGAAILASRAALHSGSGLVTLGTPGSLQDLMGRSLVEVMTLALPETKEGSLSLRSFARILTFIHRRKINSLAIGPGLSQNQETMGLVRKLVTHVKTPVVLDADGLNSFKGKAGLLRHHQAGLVLTPHRREFERLFKTKLPSRGLDRMKLAKKLAKFYDVVLVLKDHKTLVISTDHVYVNTTGNPGMAKGGSGDVLTGMIASFMAQGLGLFQAAAWAVYFHGKAGDLAVKQKGELGLIASDLIDFLPKAFRAH